MVEQIKADRQGQFLLAALEIGMSSIETMKAAMEIAGECKQVEEEDAPELTDGFDDVSGAPLDPQKKFEARIEGVKFIREMNLYDKLAEEECW